MVNREWGETSKAVYKEIETTKIDLALKHKKVRADGTDKNCFTFVLHNEDHTLGNSLRYMIMKNPEVEFCGYSITHPSERKINLRIQTKGLPAVDVFQKGLEDLRGVCQHVLSKFEVSLVLSNPLEMYLF
uniref:DNA-directed RNA polymerases I and III subunit RPAC2 n=1 Tax=Podarcis muralis TaxID=64176 RepID=A0A670K5I3_PODMU